MLSSSMVCWASSCSFSLCKEIHRRFQGCLGTCKVTQRMSGLDQRFCGVFGVQGLWQTGSLYGSS